jgi:hypothetical protein
MYAAAAQCELSKGFEVGNATISFVDGKVHVDISLYKDTYYLESTHVYVGGDLVPKTENGDNILAPGQFGNTHEFSPINTVGDKFEISPPLGQDFFIIVHASVCGQKSTSRRLMMRGHDNVNVL